ncbi:gliadoralin-A [Rattus rattus]|uniref:gliadoralin-A n=1 Tax=Rattus rattus TaxID=10117 RepID=UPI0013F38A22|nr:gliadoralin-A [Rattus rattus]XP_032760965.1 gliadoralin-A [Rattus rattus]
MLVILLMVVMLALSSAQDPNRDFVVSSQDVRERQPSSQQGTVGGQSQESQLRDQQQQQSPQQSQEQQPQPQLQQAKQPQRPVKGQPLPQQQQQQNQRPRPRYQQPRRAV